MVRWYGSSPGHEIDYKRPAFEGDKLIARTWVGYYEHHKCERFTEIIRESDNRILASVRTLWCPISLETKRTVRLTEEQIGRYFQGTQGLPDLSLLPIFPIKSPGEPAARAMLATSLTYILTFWAEPEHKRLR